MTDVPPSGEPSFQWEMIRQLAESVRAQTTSLGRLQEQMTAVSERLVRIEANRVHDDVARLGTAFEAERARVDALMRDKDRRDGAIGAAEWLQRSAPWAWLLAIGTGIFAWLRSA